MAFCKACDAEIPAGARFCPSCGTHLQVEEEETRRPVTVLFADVVGFTSRAERLDPELVRRIMTGYFSAMSHEIKDEGGRLEKFIGDAVMAVFGVPTAHEDDPRRAVRAAARMLKRLEARNQTVPEEHQLAIRIGVNTGEVVFAPGERDLSVTGDPVNVAARLQSAAPPGAVLIGERTARAVRYDFDLEEGPALELKGKSKPVRAWLLRGGADNISSRSQRLLSGTFVGREHELDEMASLYDWVRQERHAALISVVAEPGVGKSRLLKEFIARAESSARVMTGFCPPAGGGALAALREIVKNEAGIREDYDEGLTRQRLLDFVRQASPLPEPEIDELIHALELTLGIAVPDAEEQGARQAFHQLRQGWTKLLEQLAEARPLVICLEDMHWADDSLIELVAGWASDLEAPALFVCTAREPFMQDTGDDIRASTIELSPLGKNEARALLTDLTSNLVVDHDLAETILERAEGNPFFVEETVRSLADGDAQIAGRESSQIPDTVQGVILSRIDRLPGEARRLLQAAAVVGRDFWEESVHELLPEVPTDTLIPDLVEKGFISWVPRRIESDEPELSFRHILVRDVAYATLRLSSRADFHKGTVAWLEKRQPLRHDSLVEPLAHHLTSAYSAVPDSATRLKARTYCIRAARAAAASFATHRARGWGDRALALSEDSERLEVLELLGNICYAAGQGDGAWAAYEIALEESERQGSSEVDFVRISAKAALLATRFAGSLQDPIPRQKVSDLIGKALAVEPFPNDRDKASLLLSSAILRAENREPGAKEVADEALALARTLNDPDMISAGIDISTLFSFSEGRWREVLDLASERETLLDRLTDPREVLDHYGSVAWASFYLGRFGETEDYATRCIDEAREVDAGSYMHGLAWRICARVLTGKWQESEADQLELERLVREDGRDLPVPYVLRAYAASALRLALQGKGSAAEGILSILEESRRRKTPRGAFEAHMARALMHLGQLDRAWEVLESDSGGHSGCLEETKCINLEARCELTAASARWETVPSLVQETRAYAEQGGFIALPAYADRLAGAHAFTLGDHTEAERSFHRSAELFATLGSPWERARSLRSRAEAMLGRGEATGAAGVLSEVVAITKRLGWASECRSAEEMLARKEAL